MPAEQPIVVAEFAIAWPIWSEGYPSQDEVSAAIEELSEEIRDAAVSCVDDVIEASIELQTRLEGHEPMSGPRPAEPRPNSIVLSISVFGTIDDSKPSPYSVESSVRHFAVALARRTGLEKPMLRQLEDLLRTRMPGARAGANRYDVFLPYLPVSRAMAVARAEREPEPSGVVWRVLTPSA